MRSAAHDVGLNIVPPVLSLENLLAYGKGRKKKDSQSNVRMRAVRAMLFATTICALAVSSLVLNEGKLSAEDRAWLWHWRWGHGDWNGPVTASQGLNPADVLTDVRLNVDCEVCDKAHFKRDPYPRNDPDLHADDPPFWRVYADGYGGQGSMGAVSYEGAIGGFVFYDRSSKTLRTKLYASTEQFPILLYQFLQDVEREHYTCKEIVVDTHSVNISAEAYEVAALFRTTITPISAGTPQENAYAESGVRVLAEISRAMMIGAPHLPGKCWALADIYATWVRDVKPQPSPWVPALWYDPPPPSYPTRGRGRH